MRIAPFNLQNFSKKYTNNKHVLIDKGKATDTRTNKPYSGHAETENKNGDVFLIYKNGLLMQAISYKPYELDSGEIVYAKIVKDYLRDNDSKQIKVETACYNPWANID